jgi:hypothetical protein
MTRTNFIRWEDIDVDVRFVPDKHTQLDFYIVHRNNSPRIDMSLQSETLFWFRDNQSLLFLLNASSLAEK